MASDFYDIFRRAIDCPEDQIDLGHAAAAIAKSEYPHLDIEDCLSQLDRLGQAVERRLGDERNPYRIIAAVNTVLFKKLGYEGNRDNYYDPKNSYLNDVIERKRGIPISLSVLYMEIARRVGLSLSGVGFPGHFLVKYQDDDAEIVIDVFNKGEILAREDLDKLLQRLYGSQLPFQPNYLAATGKREILWRMLSNLKLIYLQGNEPLKALSIVEQLVILDPVSAREIRDRGLLSMKLERYGKAVEDLEKYLRLAPGADDVIAIRAQIESIKQRSIQIH